MLDTFPSSITSAILRDVETVQPVEGDRHLIHGPAVAAQLRQSVTFLQKQWMEGVPIGPLEGRRTPFRM